jgi:hypothetical protein
VAAVGPPSGPMAGIWASRSAGLHRRRARAAPVVAELPPRMADNRSQRCTGVALNSRGAQGLIDSTAQDLQRGQAARETQEATAVADALVSGDGAADLRVAVAMDGVMAHLDGRWQETKVATILLRRLEAPAEEPTFGAVLARRSVGILGSAEELAARIAQGIREADWERIPMGAILGDGAPLDWDRGRGARSGGMADARL